MTYTFEQVRNFLKASKSDAADAGPYTLKGFVHQDWAEIIDRHGNIVGQVSGLELRLASQ